MSISAYNKRSPGLDVFHRLIYSPLHPHEIHVIIPNFHFTDENTEAQSS